MLSRDLLNLMNALSRKRDAFQGQIFYGAPEAAALVACVAAMAEDAAALERQLVPHTARTAAPDGVIDLAARRHRPIAPTGGGDAA
ncbi:hypothetical protein HL658_31195 [Azospirillum sp. RWY-5-1]|uniref:Uncharacterized protein n=1 Tax=Azospirillum oleiclasticum TaxID=2735135 RepID=A0ABX2TJK4_9PROT|nr:hypothetical protein [Azospirillum oleiclasticum]NYZ17031.1 hypothetical protein [Azospirillum oleiclasticum]NYZ24525.1 hypothetical protein [Azospirillum oleiclasticum]